MRDPEVVDRVGTHSCLDLTRLEGRLGGGEGSGLGVLQPFQFPARVAWSQEAVRMARSKEQPSVEAACHVVVPGFELSLALDRQALYCLNFYFLTSSIAFIAGVHIRSAALIWSRMVLTVLHKKMCDSGGECLVIDTIDRVQYLEQGCGTWPGTHRDTGVTGRHTPSFCWDPTVTGLLLASCLPLPAELCARQP
jgi:hypothetical protein